MYLHCKGNGGLHQHSLYKSRYHVDQCTPSLRKTLKSFIACYQFLFALATMVNNRSSVCPRVLGRCFPRISGGLRTAIRIKTSVSGCIYTFYNFKRFVLFGRVVRLVDVSPLWVTVINNGLKFIYDFRRLFLV